MEGNIHGNEIQAGEVCLYYANMLLTKYGENDKVTEQEAYRENVNKPKQEVPEGEPARRASTELSREQLKFNDNVVQGELYKEWKKFNHPTYGEIEIGGWVKMSSRLPHPFMLPELVNRNASVVLLAAENTPEITMEVFDVKKIGNNLNQVRVRLHNKRGLPSMSANTVKNEIVSSGYLKGYGWESGCRRENN